MPLLKRSVKLTDLPHNWKSLVDEKRLVVSLTVRQRKMQSEAYALANAMINERRQQKASRGAFRELPFDQADDRAGVQHRMCYSRSGIPTFDTHCDDETPRNLSTIGSDERYRNADIYSFVNPVIKANKDSDDEDELQHNDIIVDRKTFNAADPPVLNDYHAERIIVPKIDDIGDTPECAFIAQILNFGYIAMTVVPVLFNYAKLTARQKSRLWLRRFAYPGIDRLIKMTGKAKAHGIDFTDNHADDDDPIAARARFRNKPFKTGNTDHSGLPPGHSVSIDHVSGFKAKSIHGAQSAYIAVCLSTNWCWVFLVRDRSEYPSVLKKLIDVIASMGHKLARVRSDSAPEIIAGGAASVAVDNDIIIEPTGTYCPQAGGKHESCVQRTCQRARSMMLLSPWLPRSLWALAMLWAATLTNVMPTDIFGTDESPYERWHRRIPNLLTMNIHAFGCLVQFGLTKAERMATAAGKMASLTATAFFVGKSGNLILLYHGGQVRTAQVQKCQFFEGMYTARFPPSSPTPATIDEGEATVADAQGARALDEERSAGDAGVKVVQSEQATRPAHDLMNKISRDYEDLKIGDQPAFDDMTTVNAANASASTSDLINSATNQTPMVIDESSTATTDLAVDSSSISDDDEGDRAKTRKRKADEDDDNDGDAKQTGDKSKHRMPTRSASKIANFVHVLITTLISNANDMSDAAIAQLKQLPDPRSVYDCITSVDVFGWHSAARSEMASWLKNNVYTVIKKCDRLRHLRTFPLSDVWKRKWNADATWSKWKLRLVVFGQLFRRGSAECPGNTFSPTISATATRLFFAIACQTGYSIKQIDIATAYLTSPSAGQYYAHRPNVFNFAKMSKQDIIDLRNELKTASPERREQIKRQLNGKFDPGDDSVLFISRTVYGDPCGSRSYWLKFQDVMITLGFVQSLVEPCFWYRKMADGTSLIAINFADDVCYCGNDAAVAWFHKNIQLHFDITGGDDVDSFLGMKVKQNTDEGTLECTAAAMIDNICERFRTYIGNAKPRTLPAKPGLQLSPATDDEFTAAKKLPFQAIVGCLCWLTTWVKLECQCICSQLGSHNAKWSTAHFNAAIDAIMYCKYSKDKGIRWTKSRDRPCKIYGYCDADLGMHYSGRSRTGSVVFMTRGPVACTSFLQTVIQLSTAAAELVALMHCAMTIGMLRNLLKEIGYEQLGPTVIAEDNMSAIAVANSQSNLPRRSKYLDLRTLKIKQMVDTGVIAPHHVRTAHQIADLLSKNLNSTLFPKFASYLCGYSDLDSVAINAEIVNLVFTLTQT